MEMFRRQTTIVSWLPFYHDMGLIVGIVAPLVIQRSAVLLSPMSFLQKPARWMQLLASNPRAFSGAPNLAFDLAVRRTSDDDMAGHDLGDVQAILNGSERIHAATIARFNERFARFNLSETAIRPSYGLAEATVYVATSKAGQPASTALFDYEQLSAGQAKPSDSQADGGTELVSYHLSGSPLVRIVNPETKTENPAGTIGEIWVHGENVAMGYWRNPTRTRAHIRRTTCQSHAGHAGGSLAQDGGPGRHVRRRVVHHGPYQGSADRRMAATTIQMTSRQRSRR